MSALINHVNVTRTATISRARGESRILSYIRPQRHSTHFVLTSVKTRRDPPRQCSFSSSLLPPPLFLSFYLFLLFTVAIACNFVYATLNKSARTEPLPLIPLVRAALLPRSASLCPRHLFRPARGPPGYTRAQTHQSRRRVRDRFVKYEDFNQKDDGIRARISWNENYRDADSEELMIDALASAGKGKEREGGEGRGRRSLKTSRTRDTLSMSLPFYAARTRMKRRAARVPESVNAPAPACGHGSIRRRDATRRDACLSRLRRLINAPGMALQSAPARNALGGKEFPLPPDSTPRAGFVRSGRRMRAREIRGNESRRERGGRSERNFEKRDNAGIESASLPLELKVRTCVEVDFG